MSVGQSSGSSKLLLKILTKLEEVRQTVNSHTSTMQSILRRVNLTEEMVAASLPEGVRFPLACHADINSIEGKLQDTQTKNTLVRTNSSIYWTVCVTVSTK